MDILRFVRWWWKRCDTSGKIFFSALGGVILSLIIAKIFGLSVILTFLTVVSVGLIGFVISLVLTTIYKQWKLFQAERDAEAQQIVDRLAGKSVLTDTQHEIIRKLRLRAGRGTKP